MLTLEKVLEQLAGRPDRATLETYIAHAWVRPLRRDHDWVFEEIDIARIRLVHQLRHDIATGDDSMDVLLHLLDQVYGLHEQLRRLASAIDRQPESVKTEILALLK